MNFHYFLSLVNSFVNKFVSCFLNFMLSPVVSHCLFWAACCTSSPIFPLQPFFYFSVQGRGVEIVTMTLGPHPPPSTFIANKTYLYFYYIPLEDPLLNPFSVSFIRVLLHRQPGCSPLLPCSHSHLLYLPPLDSNTSNTGNVRLTIVGLSAKDTECKGFDFLLLQPHRERTETTLCVVCR